MKLIIRKGFTLLELLVVAVILTLLSVVIAQVFFSTMRTNSKTEALRDVKGNGDRALEVITRLVQNAESIELPELPAACAAYPAVGDPIDEITLKNADEGETKLECVADGVNGIARIASTSALPQTVYLTSANVTLIDPTLTTNACTNHALSFTCSSVGGTPSYVTVSFTLRQKNSYASVVDSGSATFQTTVTLRNR